MKFYTETKIDDASGKWYVECGCREPLYKEIGTASEGNTQATAMRKAARSFAAEAKRLRKDSFKYE